MKLIADNIEKRFGYRSVLQAVCFELPAKGTMVITGRNGSGKSTLARIICGLLSPSAGAIAYHLNGRVLHKGEIFAHIGLVAPYLQLYRDLSAWENLVFMARSRGQQAAQADILAVLDQVGLKKREHDLLKHYSSGMLQRAKYAAAIYHTPALLVLDEPTANLDDEGKQVVYELIESRSGAGTTIIATNEPDETRFGDTSVELA